MKTRNNRRLLVILGIMALIAAIGALGSGEFFWPGMRWGHPHNIFGVTYGTMGWTWLAGMMFDWLSLLAVIGAFFIVVVLLFSWITRGDATHE